MTIKNPLALLPSRTAKIFILLVGAALATSHTARAASASWTLGSSGSWNVSGDWSGSNIPGSTSSTSSTDVATFSGATGGTITVDSNRDIGGIAFVTTTGSYTLSSGNLLLSPGGVIDLAPTVTSAAKTETIATPITLEGNGTFANYSTTTDVLNFTSASSITSAATSGVTTLTLSGGNSGSNVIEAVISNGGGSNTVGLTESGTGNWVLGATNTYTGATTINQGTLALDFTQAGAPATNIISSSSPLAMAGGSASAILNVIGASGATNSQSFNNTSFGQGASSFTINNNATSNNVLVSLGALTRSEGATVNFVQPVNGSVGAANGYTTSTSNTNGILGAWATVGGNDWATNNGVNIVAYTGYTSVTGASNPISGWSAGQNISIDGTPTGGLTLNKATSFSAPSVTTINSLRFNTAGAETVAGSTATNNITFLPVNDGVTLLTLSSGNTSALFDGEILGSASQFPGATILSIVNSTQIVVSAGPSANLTVAWAAPINANQLVVSSGGIIVSSAVGANKSTISNAQLVGPAGGDIIIDQNNGTTSANGLVIAAAIDDIGSTQTSLTLTGPGYTTLTNLGDAYTGQTSVDAGTLEVDAGLNMGPVYVASGAVLTQTPTTGGSTITNLTVGSLTGAGTIKYYSPSTVGLFTINETSNTLFSGTITAVSTVSSLSNVNKNGAGTLTMTGILGLYRPLTVNAGTLDFVGTGAMQNILSGGNARQTLTINQGAAIVSDDSINNVNNRTFANNGFFVNGGSYALIGSGTVASTESLTAATGSSQFGGLTAGAGADTFSVTAGAGEAATLTMSGLVRTAGASLLFKGSSMGSAPGANVGTVKFSTAPTLTGTGAAGNPAYGVIAGAIVDSIVSGVDNFSIATYDSTNGVRPLAGSETTGALTASDNILATSAQTNASLTINSLTLGTGGSIDNTAGTLAVTAGTILSTGASTSIGVGGGSVLESGSTGAAELVVYNAPGSTLTIGANIQTTGGFTKGGAGTTVLTANNSATLSGTDTINGGILSISDPTNLGTGVVAINNGGEFQSTAASMTLNRAIIVGGTLVNTLTSGDIDVSAAPTNVLSTGTGVISGVGTLTKSGVGTLTIASVSTFSGGATVNAGTLFVSGSLTGTGPVTVNSGGTLGGGGLIDGATTVASGGVINPGAGLTTGTTLTINSGVTFNNSTFAVNIDSAGNTVDKLSLIGTSGNLTLNGADLLTFDLVNGSSLSNLAVGTYEIASYTGTLTGTFTPDGTLQSNWSISYSTPDEINLVVTAVPEPETWAALVGSLGLLLVGQKFRRRTIR